MTSATTPGGRVGLAALAAVALLSGCALFQRPAPAAEPPAPDGEADVGAAAVVPRPEPAPPAAAAEPGDAPAAPAAPAAAPARPKATPQAQQRARGDFAEGVRLRAAGDDRAAAAAFERAAAADPELGWASFDAGLLRERLGDDAAAAAAYAAALEARPDLAQAGLNLARVRIRQGQAAQAVEGLRQQLARADGVGLRVALAEVLLASGDVDGAELESRAALKADEKNVVAMVVLATAYQHKKRFELARMVLDNARQVDEGDPAVWNRMGFVDLALGDRVRAIEDFRTAASLRVDYPEAHANYGAMLADTDDYPGAVQELELAVKHGPRLANAWLNLGNAYRGEKAFEKAEEAYRQAKALTPASPDVDFNLAVLYLDGQKAGLATLARLEQALKYFDAFEKGGGVEPRVAVYRKDAAREIEREKKRLQREEKDRVRKEAEAKVKAAEEATRLAEEEAARKAAEAKAKDEAAREAPPPPPPPPGRGPDHPAGPAGPRQARKGWRQVKDLRALVAVSAAVLTILAAAPVRAQAAGEAKDKKATPRKVLRLEEMKVEGRVYKPQAMYLMPRANLNIGELDRSESFLPKVTQAVQKAPF